MIIEGILCQVSRRVSHCLAFPIKYLMRVQNERKPCISKRQFGPQFKYTIRRWSQKKKMHPSLPRVRTKVNTLLCKLIQILHRPPHILLISRSPLNIDISRVLPRTGARNVSRTRSRFQLCDVDIAERKTGTDAMKGADLILHDEGKRGFGGHVSVGLVDWVTGNEPVPGDVVGCRVLT